VKKKNKISVIAFTPVIASTLATTSTLTVAEVLTSFIRKKGKSEMEDVLIRPFDKELQVLPLTHITKRRRTKKGREEQYFNKEEYLSTRKRKQDRVLDYLKKINKEVGDLRKEILDI
ncbi:8965_t:CDS:2, partial [Diversispora eburnea]